MDSFDENIQKFWDEDFIKSGMSRAEYSLDLSRQRRAAEQANYLSRAFDDGHAEATATWGGDSILIWKIL